MLKIGISRNESEALTLRQPVLQVCRGSWKWACETRSKVNVLKVVIFTVRWVEACSVCTTESARLCGRRSNISLCHRWGSVRLLFVATGIKHGRSGLLYNDTRNRPEDTPENWWFSVKAGIDCLLSANKQELTFIYVKEVWELSQMLSMWHQLLIIISKFAYVLCSW